MHLVQPELLGVIGFIVGIFFGVGIGFFWGRKRGYDEGFHDGRC